MSARPGAIAVVFAANGLAGPSFLARLPERQDALDLSDGTLGLVLVGLAFGALVASPVAGRLVNAVGSRTVSVAAAVALGGCLWLAGAAPNAGTLFAALAVVGAVDAAMDIAMNANGATYEDLTSRSVMHRLHAAWSFGALAAAGVAALAATADVPLTVHLAVVGALLAAASVVARPALVPTDPDGGPGAGAAGGPGPGDADGSPGREATRPGPGDADGSPGREATRPGPGDADGDPAAEASPTVTSAPPGASARPDAPAAGATGARATAPHPPGPPPAGLDDQPGDGPGDESGGAEPPARGPAGAPGRTLGGAATGEGPGGSAAGEPARSLAGEPAGGVEGPAGGLADGPGGAAAAPGTGAPDASQSGRAPGEGSRSPADEPGGTPAGGLADGPGGDAAAAPGTGPADASQSGRARGGRRGERRVAGALVVLAAATVAGAVIEGAPTDWSAILLQRYGTTEGVAALGVAAFTAGMVAGRLAGDWLTDRLGGARMLRLGGALVAAGLTLGAATGNAGAFLAGLVVAGVGAAGFFPLAFSAAARTPGVSAGAGAATVSLAARLGFLAEPVLLGAVSEAVGLRWAFGLVAGTAAVLAVAARRVIPPGAGGPGGPGGPGATAGPPPTPTADGIHAP